MKEFIVFDTLVGVSLVIELTWRKGARYLLFNNVIALSYSTPSPAYSLLAVKTGILHFAVSCIVTVMLMCRITLCLL